MNPCRLYSSLGRDFVNVTVRPLLLRVVIEGILAR